MIEYLILAVILAICIGLVWKFAWPKADVPTAPAAPYKLDIDLSIMAPNHPDPDATPVPPLNRADFLTGITDIDSTPTIKFKPKTPKTTNRLAGRKTTTRVTPRKHKKPKVLK